MVGEWERRMSLSVKFFGDAAAVVREAYRLLNVWGKMGKWSKESVGCESGGGVEGSLPTVGCWEK